MFLFFLGQTIEPEDQFYEQLEVFLNSSSGNRFIDDIKWNKDKTAIMVINLNNSHAAKNKINRAHSKFN